MPPITIHPLSPDRSADFVALFGPQGACYGCWCTAYLLRPKQRQAMTGDERRDLMLNRIARDRAPGLLAYDGETPIGWMQIGPRADTPEWNNPGRVSSPLSDAPPEDASVWAITCFFFARRWRGKGLTHHLVEAGIAFARANGARMIEAAPNVSTKPKSIPLCVGPFNTFERAGFVEVAHRKDGRPLMRLML